MNGIEIKVTSPDDTIEGVQSGFEELKACDIKVTIKLENVSNSFSPNVLQALEHQRKTSKIEQEIKIFVPRFFRTFKDEENNLGKIEALSTELQDWVEDYFGHLLVSGYVEKVVQHAISHIFWVCPFHSVDSLEFKTMSCFAIVGFILEDWVDSSKAMNNLEEESETGANENEACKNRMEVVEYLTNLLETGEQGSKGLNETMKNSKSSTMEIMNKEPIVPALYDGLMDIYEMAKEVQPDLNRKKCFAAFRITAMGCFQGFQWSQDTSGKQTMDVYSVEVCRYFKQLEIAFEGYTSMLGLLEGYDLPDEVKGHAVFFKWYDLAGKMIVIQNDVLSFQKNVENGKEDGIIIKKLRKGLSVQAGVDEEMALLSEFTSDYINLRRILFTRFKDNQKVHRYIDIVDSYVFGNFQTFTGSNKYGMKDHIQIIH